MARPLGIHSSGAAQHPVCQICGLGSNEIDRFILARLERDGLNPSKVADRATLLRRVTLDLTGLPPTLDEIRAFVTDRRPGAYERVVDRLLSSVRYGERMALDWMDAARYGDSSVFHADGPRDMWPWRNWVIRAYNNNMPFNKFTVEQLAGDLIPNATVDQQVATGFNRNHGTTDEGGAIDEEYRVEYIVDRVKTTATVWLGLTMECAQCHDHKYDPISQREYYGFFAYFNQSSDRGMQTRRGNAQPLVDVPRADAGQQLAIKTNQLASLKQRQAGVMNKEQAPFIKWLNEQSAQVGKKPMLPGNPELHLPLDEAKGTQVRDLVNTKRVGNIRGPALWSSGKAGGALKFNARNFVDLGTAADFERKESFSYGAWVYVDKNTSGAPIAKMNDKNDFRGFDLYLAGRKVSAHIIHKWDSDCIKVTTKRTLAPNKWYHLFVTYDGTSKASGIKIYVDGKSEPWAIERDNLKNTIRTKANLYLGRRSNSSQFRGQLDDVRFYRRRLSDSDVATLAGSDPLRELLAKPADKRSREERERIRQYYFTNFSAAYKSLVGEIGKVEGQIAELSKPISTVMVMKDLDKPRMTYILDRGNYASPKKDKVIQPDTPAFLPRLSDRPQNRLGLAQWIVDPSHPLTSRVTVNRLWQMLFGTGLVKTAEDFGVQGEWPSHPALLDWLAVDFVESGWDVKRMLKQMVMSSTYRQSSRITAELYRVDPDNRLLARGPRFRLKGEFIRAQALAVSGLLVNSVGGRGVKPYQPPGLWNEVSLSGNVRFVQDHGDKLYRRSMYTYWKRSSPAPALMIFDTPSREKCRVRRPRTNTPLQALVVLNDPQYVEAARQFAQRVLLEGGATDAARISFAYRAATGVEPKPAVLRILTTALVRERKTFSGHTDRAEQLLKVGEFLRDARLDAAEHAAWTIITSMILNLDATLTRG